jgi:hypothetical protein
MGKVFPLTYHNSQTAKPAALDVATGRLIAKDPLANVEIRRGLLQAANNNPAVQADLYELCRRSPYFFINYFVWVPHQLDITDDGREITSEIAHIPFVTWPVQDNAIGEVIWCIRNGRNVVIDKSRWMGATQLVISIAAWIWLFWSGRHSLLVSRKAEVVETAGDPDTLFGKLDYLLAYLPDWMLPAPKLSFDRGKQNRRERTVINPKGGGTVRGEATIADIGVGARKVFILYDEAARIAELIEAIRAGRDTTGCQILLSTPKGSGTEFTKARNRAVEDKGARLIELMYYNHPLKAHDREWKVDTDGSVTQQVGETFCDCQWLREKIKEADDPVYLAENVFASHETAGSHIFRPRVITKHINEHAAEPKRCELIFDDDGKATGFEESETGIWYVWLSLDRYGHPVPYTDYVAFADIGNGIGSNNSVCAFMDRNTRKVVAECVTNTIDPYEFAEEIVAACKDVFIGTAGPCFLGWEANGPGEAWDHHVVERLNFRRVYYSRREGSKGAKKTRRYGWRSTRGGKRRLFGGLAAAMGKEEVIIPSKAGLLEMLDYIQNDQGLPVPGHLRDSPPEVREQNGDRAIAYSGLVFMVRESYRMVTPAPSFAEGTYGELFGLKPEDFI